MTPAELNLYARAYAQHEQERQKLTQANLYSLAALIRTMVWAKTPPSIDSVFPSLAGKPENEEMSDEQMYAQVRALNAIFGGKEVS